MGRFALVPIHMEHVSNILSGKKVFEYRKIVPREELTHLVLYCTAPIKKIIAIVEVMECVVGSPTRVWELTCYGSGISRKFYRNYFSGQHRAIAFVLGNVYEMSMPVVLSELRRQKTPPQSLCYLDEDDTQLILQRVSKTPNFSSSMLFLGGIHGVDKRTRCRRVFGPLGYHCEIASALIATSGKTVSSDKQVSNISDNQSVLIQRLSLLKERYCRLLLDGHFTLINQQGQVEPIDVSVFETIKPDQFILIRGEVKEICSYLAARDGKNWDIPLLSKFQDAEIDHARHVASKIGVPLQIYDSTISFARLAKLVDRKHR